MRITRVLAYRRVSTREQGISGTSLDAQKTEIERYCAAQGWPAPMDFVEMESGGEESETKRREAMRLLGNVRPGDAIVVSKIDRFGRDMVFIVKHVRGIKKKGACFVSIAECFDSRRPESEMMLGAWAMAADMERRRIQERTSGPRKLLRSQGLFVEGRAPLGYRLAKDGSRRLVVEPEEAKIVKNAFELAANGVSGLKISMQLTTENPERKRFSVNWVIRTLHNPIYTGKISKTPVKPADHKSYIPLPGDWVRSHEPIISVEMFATVQKAMATRIPGRKPKNESRTASFLMRGLTRCAMCGAILADFCPHKESNGYYVCNRKRLAYRKVYGSCADSPYLRQEATDASVRARVIAYLKVAQKSLGRPPAAVKPPDFDERRAVVVKKRERVIKLVAENLIGFDAATSTLKEIEREMGTIDAEEGEHKASLSQDTVENRKGARDFLERVSDEWSSLTIVIQRELIKIMAKEITVGKDKMVRIVWKDASELAIDYAVGALPVLRAPVLKALPAPQAMIADLLGLTEQHAETVNV
jgi:DNA invertase Pin-like site-specific DNA recombinase